MAAKAKVIGDEVVLYFRERCEYPDAKVIIDVQSEE